MLGSERLHPPCTCLGGSPEKSLRCSLIADPTEELLGFRAHQKPAPALCRGEVVVFHVPEAQRASSVVTKRKAGPRGEQRRAPADVEQPGLVLSL